MEDNKKVIFNEEHKNKLINEIDELKKNLLAQILKSGINNKKTLETSQKLDELLIKYTKYIYENENK